MKTQIDQNLVFKGGEGNAWFSRNRMVLRDDRPTDCVMDQLAPFLPGIETICEVGCSNGWRLAQLARSGTEFRRIAGFDVSGEAIEDGKRQWAALDLRVGSADEAPFRSSFDAVIVSFVLHWVDRAHLARSISEIDRLVAKGGLLVLADFLPDAPCARRYAHRSDVELFTYKQDYSLCFTSLGVYREESCEIFHHSGRELPILDEQDRAFCKVLRKS